MLATDPVLTLDDARRFVADHGFVPPTPSSSRSLLGVEIEWQTVSIDDPGRPVPFDLLEATAQQVHLAAGSRLTFEPGGQVELSSAALPGFEAAGAILADARALTAALSDVGVGLVGLGLLPGDARPRALHSPRYDAMEAHFDAFGPAGRTMMRQTAAIQVNIDLGNADEMAGRWRTAHALGPVLAASFANSPFLGSAPSGWCSTRLAVWLAIERGRSAPVGADGSAGSAWADYALRAPVMFIRVSDDEFVPLREHLSFADWITNGHELGWPTDEELAYHLTTLFPPIRPRGWLELRMVDSLPSDWSIVPAVVAVALLEDVEASARIAPVLEPTEERWDDAAHYGLRAPEFAKAACECFAAALDALPGLGASAEVVDAVEHYRERFVSRERCPADDLVDTWKTTGRLVPDPEP